MPIHLTIILDTGGFLPPETEGQTYLDVGYFQTRGASDIEVSKDGTTVEPPPNRKLGDGNQRIEVEHLERDGTTVKSPVNLSDSYERDILKKYDLYDRTDMPDFITTAYDCILRFNSGDFESADVQVRSFTEHLCSNDSATGNDKTTDHPIANEIHVHYDLEDGEVLRFRREKGPDLWSSTSVGSGAKNVEVKIWADASKNPDYHKTALNHKCATYYLPNSDPPPMNGPKGG
jgi:hypothetical protein